MDTKKPKFPNLQAELARIGLTITDLAKSLGVSRQALYNKTWGNTPMTLIDAKRIKEIIEKLGGASLTIDYLFYEG